MTTENDKNYIINELCPHCQQPLEYEEDFKAFVCWNCQISIAYSDYKNYVIEEKALNEITCFEKSPNKAK